MGLIRNKLVSICVVSRREATMRLLHETTDIF